MAFTIDIATTSNCWRPPMSRSQMLEEFSDKTGPDAPDLLK
jgi:hypothetical protein